MIMYYRRDGTPYPEGHQGVLEWAKDFENYSYKKLKDSILPNGRWVSTVWLGLDHNYGEGRPHIFESMVFPAKNNYSELAQERYSTEAEALEGHERLCKEFSNE